MPLDIRSQVVTALDNINRNPELYTPPKPTTPLETRINDLKETNPSKYRDYISTLTSSANRGNEEARELLGKVGEDAARQRRGYEGLNEFMVASTGGLPGIIANYLPKIIGSAWNGYSMFDPNSPGIVTKNFQKTYPKTSIGLNLLVSLPSAGLVGAFPGIKKTKGLLKVYHGSPEPLPNGVPIGPGQPGYKSGVGRIQRTEGGIYVTPNKSYAERYMSSDIKRGLLPTNNSRLYTYWVDDSKLLHSNSNFFKVGDRLVSGSKLSNLDFIDLKKSGFNGVSFMAMKGKPEISLKNASYLHFSPTITTRYYNPLNILMARPIIKSTNNERNNNWNSR